MEAFDYHNHDPSLQQVFRRSLADELASTQQISQSSGFASRSARELPWSNREHGHEPGPSAYSPRASSRRVTPSAAFASCSERFLDERSWVELDRIATAISTAGTASQSGACTGSGRDERSGRDEARCSSVHVSPRCASAAARSEKGPRTSLQLGQLDPAWSCGGRAGTMHARCNALCDARCDARCNARCNAPCNAPELRRTGR